MSKETTKDKKEKNNKNTNKKSKDTKNITKKENNKTVSPKKDIKKVEKKEIEEIIIEEDEFLDEEEIIEKPKKEKKVKKDKKEKEKKNEKIAKIEKKVKEKKKKEKINYNKYLEYIDKNRFTIYGFIAGIIITTLVAILIWPDRIATLKDGTQNIATIKGHSYTADTLYERMKDYYSVNQLLDMIDNDILSKMYEENDEMSKEIKSNAEYYLNMYKQYYNYTEEQFLESNGFKNYDEFLNYLRLDYRRNKYLDEYVEKNITDKEINEYYKEKVYGDINVQHILVETKSDDSKDGLSDEDAKKLAEEIIEKLNNGTSWEDVQNEYKDKVTYEDLGYQSWNANLEESFIEALKKLDNNSYSKEPVKTSYGYHVIYRLDQKDKKKLKKVKDEIIEAISTEKKNADSNLLYKALISLREEKKIKFTDTVLKSKYESYKKQYK